LNLQRQVSLKRQKIEEVSKMMELISKDSLLEQVKKVNQGNVASKGEWRVSSDDYLCIVIVTCLYRCVVIIVLWLLSWLWWDSGCIVWSNAGRHRRCCRVVSLIEETEPAGLVPDQQCHTRASQHVNSLGYTAMYVQSS